jgi:hypothetical protein
VTHAEGQVNTRGFKSMAGSASIRFPCETVG